MSATVTVHPGRFALGTVEIWDSNGIVALYLGCRSKYPDVGVGTNALGNVLISVDPQPGTRIGLDPEGIGSTVLVLTLPDGWDSYRTLIDVAQYEAWIVLISEGAGQSAWTRPPAPAGVR
jgi:hypothetical protein